MPPRMTTQSVGRATAAPRGGTTSGQTVRGGGRTRGQSGDQGNGRIDGQGGQVGDQGNGKIEGQGGQVGGQGNEIHTRGQEVAVGMAWEDFKPLTREELCPSNEMQKLETKLWNHAMVGAGHATDGGNNGTEIIQMSVQKARTLTDKAVRNGSLKKNPEKRRNGEEPNRDMNLRDENKRTRIGNAFATTTNLVRREYNGTIPKCVSCNLHHPPKIPCRAFFYCGRIGHMAKDCRVAPRMVNPLNLKNPTAAPGACYECGGTGHFKAACPRLNQAPRP
ncbi:reverse transcriptase domain-containing protein [Tanacetum coccineum]